jgi:acyl carrier protein
MMTYLDTKLPWSRPSDTGRSTNCLINEVGIHIHKKREGYHNYAFPYSWDVRIGHKTREETIDEINEHISEENVNKILKEINYTFETEKNNEYLTAYIVKNNNSTKDDLKTHLKKYLPEGCIPQKFIELDEMPLTPNGKLDVNALKQISEENTKNVYVAPSNEIEEYLVGIWEDVFSRKQISVKDGFLELGGHSLMLIKIASRIRENLKIDMPFTEILDRSTIVNVATYIEDYIKTNLID